MRASMSLFDVAMMLPYAAPARAVVRGRGGLTIWTGCAICASVTFASAWRTAPLMCCQLARIEQDDSWAQSPGVLPHSVNPTGPFFVNVTATTEIASAL